MPSGLLLIDKAPDWTSHDVVAKCRGLLRERRIGHGGTLDPMATGLLLLFVGRATRAVSLMEGVKTYEAALHFGIETDTQDTSGRVLRTCSHIPDGKALRDCLSRFTGELSQVPPMVSAVKIGGERLYKLAREGRTVERPPRPVTIYALDWLGEEEDEQRLRIRCSAGTYIRTLIHDIGLHLGSCAAMSALRRTNIDGFSVEEALPVEEASPGHILPLDRLFSSAPPLRIPAESLRLAKNGALFPAPAEAATPGLYRCYDPAGAFLLLGRSEAGNIITVKSFFE